MESETVACPTTARKPAGGYRFITVVQLCMAWWAYQYNRIRLLDLRTWFAAHELVARRCGLKPGRYPVYTLDELHGLVGGVGGEHLRASLHRLEAIGLLTWSGTAITFATAPRALQVEDHSSLQTMLAGIRNNRRRVPVPRRILRFIAGGARRVVIATLLGHLLRCLYFRRGQCVAEGLCKARWIATVFGVDLRNVKAARKHLADIGWLTLQVTPRWVCNRWGQKVVINLAWSRPMPEKPGRDKAPVSPPPDAFSTTRLPPPDSHQKPLLGFNHQKPAARGPAGAFSSHIPVQRLPTLRHITAPDLHYTDRLLALFQEATREGRITGSDASRLQFVALAEHVLARKPRNPGGLFAALLRQRLWQVITQPEEDAARRRLHGYTDAAAWPLPSRAPGSAPIGAAVRQAPAAPAPLSHDALVVRTLTADLDRVGRTGHLLPLVQHHGYLQDWTRERWEQARQELCQRQRARSARRLAPLVPLTTVDLPEGRDASRPYAASG
jgi:hypothetical protein